MTSDIVSGEGLSGPPGPTAGARLWARGHRLHMQQGPDSDPLPPPVFMHVSVGGNLPALTRISSPGCGRCLKHTSRHTVSTFPQQRQQRRLLRRLLLNRQGRSERRLCNNQ